MFKLPFFSSLLFTSSSVAAASPAVLGSISSVKNVKEPKINKLSSIKYQEALIFQDSYSLFSKIVVLSEAYSNLGDHLFEEIKKFSDISEEEKEKIKTEIFSVIEDRDLSNKKKLSFLLSKISESFVFDTNLKKILKSYVDNLSKNWKVDFSSLYSKYESGKLSEE